jgi:hypothetical protein
MTNRLKPADEQSPVVDDRPAYFQRMDYKTWLFAKYYAQTSSYVEAVKLAGYDLKDKQDKGRSLMMIPIVREAVMYHLQKMSMSADEVKSRIAEIARGDIGEFIDEDGKFNLKAAKEKGLTGLIRKIRLNRDGSVDVEMYDKLTALLALARMYGMMVDRVETTNNVVVYIPDNHRRMAQAQEVIDVLPPTGDNE